MDLQQQVQGMGDQLASLEASLKASDAQAGTLRQQLASLGNNGPQAFKVNGQHMNGSSSPNLPKGYYYTLADLSPVGEAAEGAAAQEQPQSAELTEDDSSLGTASLPGEGVSATEEAPGRASPASSSASASTAGRTEEEEREVNEASYVGEGSEDVSQSSSSSSQPRAAQPGTVKKCTTTDVRATSPPPLHLRPPALPPLV